MILILNSFLMAGQCAGISRWLTKWNKSASIVGHKMSVFRERGWDALSPSWDVSSRFLSNEPSTPETARKFKLDKSKIQQVQAGAGIVLERGSEGNLFVAGLLKGGPAERSQSVKLGDVLYAIDRVPLDALPAREVAFLMQGHAGSLVKLTLKRFLRPETDGDVLESHASPDETVGPPAQETTLEVRTEKSHIDRCVD
jgi:hypothetical protein